MGDNQMFYISALRAHHAWLHDVEKTLNRGNMLCPHGRPFSWMIFMYNYSLSPVPGTRAQANKIKHKLIPGASK